jgi:O-antigen/teichoic acid export membrane protein
LNKINAIIKSYKNNDFIKSVLMITGGTVFAQALSVLLSPLITRLYTPDDYGILTTYSALLGMICLLSVLAYDMAIPIATDDNNALNILVFCLAILFCTTMFLTLFMITAGELVLKLFKFEELLQYRAFIPIGFFLTGLYTVFSQWALRKKDFSAISKTKYSQSIVGNSTKLICGFVRPNAVWLIIGTILSQSAGIVTLIQSNKKYFRGALNRFKYKDAKKLMIRYKAFPLYSAPGLVIISASGQLPIIFLSLLYGPSIVGLYGLAHSITFLPMTVIGKSVQDVFYGEAASLGKSNPRQIKKLSNSLLKKLIVLGMIPTLILIIFGPMLFSIVFSSDWKVAGIYSQILAIYVFFHFIFHPISSVFLIFEQQKKIIILDILRLILVLLVFGIAFTFEINSYVTVSMFSISMAIVEWLKYSLSQKIINNEIKNMDNKCVDH